MSAPRKQAFRRRVDQRKARKIVVQRRRCSACTQIREELTQRRSKESDQIVFVCESCEQLLDARGWLQ
jgi:hypothetical protein